MRRHDKRLLRALAPRKLIRPAERLSGHGGLCETAGKVSHLYYRTVAPIGLFVAGVGCIAASVLTGESEVSLFLIFPVFSGSSGLFLLGTALIIFSFVVGFMLLMIGQVELAGVGLRPPEEGGGQGYARSEKKYGGVVLIGPVPIAFGSDRKIALAMLVLGIVLAIVALVTISIFLG